MSLQIFAFLLKSLAVNPADKALLSFVFQHILPLAPKWGKVVNQDTTKYVSEEHIHENNVDHVVDESSWLEDLHVFAYLLVYVQLYDTFIHSFAVLLWILVRINGLSVIGHWKHREEGDEGHSKYWKNA